MWAPLPSREGHTPGTTDRKWRDEGRMKQGGSSKSESKTDALSGNIAQSRKLSIGELDDRMAMLLDVRVQVSLMKRDLSEILKSLGARQH